MEEWKWPEGSFVVSKDLVLKIGGGDIDVGHRKLRQIADTVVENQRIASEKWNAMTPQEQAAVVLRYGGFFEGKWFEPKEDD